jgi:hypothetical protein
MAKARKRGRARKPTAARVSRTMDRVRPLAGTPAIARRYEPGFRTTRELDREVGEGEPEVNG